MKKLITFFAALLFVGQAHAQGLSNLPPNTVIGRLGAGVPGPAQAIPITTFTATQFTGNGAALTADGAILPVQNSPTSAKQFYFSNLLGGQVWDGIRSTIINPSASTVLNVDAFGFYIQQNSTTSNAVGVYGLCAVAITNGACWGLNPALTDSFNSTIGSSVAAKLIGNESDFTVFNTSTTINGFNVQFNAKQSGTAYGNAFQVSLNGGSLGTLTNGFVANSGCCTNAATIGATATSGTSINGMPIVLSRFDSGGTGHNDTLQNNSAGFLTYNGGQLATLSAAQIWTGAQTFQSGIYFFLNYGGTFPVTNGGLAPGWNFSNGSSEVDFFNTETAATDSFRWYQQTGVSAATLLADWTTSGAKFSLPISSTSTSAPSLANGTAGLYASATLGGLLTGQGSTDDVCIINKSAASVLCVPTATQNLVASGSILLSTAASAPSLSGGQGEINSDSTSGLVINGNGSTFDMILGGSSGTAALIPHGTTNFQVQGTLRFNTGISANGSAGITQTCTVNQAKTLIFTLGILTGGTCNT